MTDEQLRALYEELMAEEGGKGGERPDPADILSALELGGSEEERLRILDRALASAEGHRELELLRVLRDGQSPWMVEDGSLSEGAGPGRTRSRWSLRPGSGWSPRRFVPLGIAATAVLAITGVLRWTGSPGGPDTIRSGTDRPELLAPAAGAEVSLPATLVWRSHPEAVEYRVEVLDADGTPVVEATLPRTDTVWVLAGVETLEPGAERSIRWWVQAILPTGTARVSEMRELRIRPEE
jgi:hypothetical protein